MFDFFKVECPVEKNEKKWIEDSLLWFYSPTREIAFMNFNFITITKYFASDNISLTEAHLHKIFAKVKQQLSMSDDLACEIKLVDDNYIPLNEGLNMQYYSKGAFTYRGYIAENKFIFEINSKYMNDPLYVVTGISCSLAFYKLKEEKGLKHINGFFNELASLVFGFGVFQANSVISQNKWSGITHYGWSVARKGFLTQQMFGYSLALSAFIKDDKSTNWSEYLCKDVKAYFDRSNKFIKSHLDYYSKYKSEIFTNPLLSSVPPDYFYVQNNYYKNAGIRSISEMKNGKLNGLTKYYHSNGVLWSEWEYKNDIPWNIFCSFNDKSEPVEKGTLVNGTGKLISYNEHGEIAFIQDYENGILKKTETVSDSTFYK